MGAADFVAEQVLAECQDDHVMLSSIVASVRPLVPKSQLKETTLGVIEKLLAGGAVVAGQFQETRFVTWDESTADSVARIAAEWEALDRDPTLAEIVWLTAPTRTGITFI